MSPRKPPDDRDVYRPKTNPYGVVIPTWDEDATAKFEAGEITRDELEEKRSKRPSDVRFAKLEKKNEDLLAAYVALLKEAADRAQAREDADRKVAREIEQAEAKDKIAARKARRKLLFTGLALGAGILEVAHQIIGLVHH